MLTLIPHANLTDLDYYELIPKCALQLLNAKALSDEQVKFVNTHFEIVDEDPLVVWHLGDLREPIQLPYVLNKEILEDCANLFDGLGIGTVEIAPDVEEPKQVNEGFDWKSLLAILIIPLVAFVVIYFAKFEEAFESRVKQVERYIPDKPLFKSFNKLKSLRVAPKIDAFSIRQSAHFKFKKMFKEQVQQLNAPQEVDEALRTFHLKRIDEKKSLESINNVLKRRKRR